MRGEKGEGSREQGAGSREQGEGKIKEKKKKRGITNYKSKN